MRRDSINLALCFYEFERATEALESMSLLLLVGTSLSVGITDLAVHGAASRRCPAVRIDPRAEQNGYTMLVRGAAEQILSGLLTALEPGVKR